MRNILKSGSGHHLVELLNKYLENLVGLSNL